MPSFAKKVTSETVGDERVPAPALSAREEQRGVRRGRQAARGHQRQDGGRSRGRLLINLRIHAHALATVTGAHYSPVVPLDERMYMPPLPW